MVSGFHGYSAGLVSGNSGSEERDLKELPADEESASEGSNVVKSGGPVVKSGGPPEVAAGAMVDPTAVLKAGVVVEAGAMVCAGAVLEEDCR